MYMAASRRDGERMGDDVVDDRRQHLRIVPVARIARPPPAAQPAELPSSLSSSHLGQRGAFFNERLDLMIYGKSWSDLELYRTTLIEKGLSVDAIAQDQFFGHDYFQLADPDGNGITVYTSHTGELSV
jgi:hypothetical protein